MPDKNNPVHTANITIMSNIGGYAGLNFHNMNTPNSLISIKYLSRRTLHFKSVHIFLIELCRQHYISTSPSKSNVH